MQSLSGAQKAKSCLTPQGTPRHAHNFHAAKFDHPYGGSGEVLQDPEEGEMTSQGRDWIWKRVMGLVALNRAFHAGEICTRGRGVAIAW